MVRGSNAFKHRFIKTEIKYNLTLDADLQSSRVSPRGYFSNLDRVLQKDIRVSAQDTCEEHDVYVQETPDLVNSIALRVDVVLSYPDANPVLDVFSPNAWEFFVSAARTKIEVPVVYCDGHVFQLGQLINKLINYVRGFLTFQSGASIGDGRVWQ